MGLSELILIAVIAVILLGPERLPDLARRIGKIVREIKRTASDIKRAIDAIDEEVRADSLPEKDNDGSKK